MAPSASNNNNIFSLLVCLFTGVGVGAVLPGPKKFPASTSKKFGQFWKKLGKFPKTSISQCLVY